jgi:hypothetical protein
MSLTDQVYAQAALLAGQLEGDQPEILMALCRASTASLTARLKEGLRPEDCKADFIAAASLYALASLNCVTDTGALEQISAGDLTIRKGGSGDAASNCLRNQANLMIAPYLKDNFSFLGV